MGGLLHNALCVLLSCSLVLMGTGCAGRGPNEAESNVSSVGKQPGSVLDNLPDVQTEGLSFGSMDDPGVRRYIQDAVYHEVATSLGDDYVVDKVEAIYISQEYLDELAYNSKANVYFGYTLSELEDVFQGQRYVFTVGEDGHTTAVPFEDYDDTFDQVVRNVAVGTGVILVCVTISAVTAGAGMPAASMIFAVAAEKGTEAALSGAVIGGISEAAFTGLQTGDMNQALNAGILGASEGFKLGAIGGAIGGGASEAVSLHGATAGGLTMDQVAIIQKESIYPLDVVENINNMEQYEYLKSLNIEPKMVNGKTALVRDIDLGFVDEEGLTNLERMTMGRPPLDPSGNPYELHHVGQRADSTFAILTDQEHRAKGISKLLHPFTESDVHKGANKKLYQKLKKEFWQEMARMLG